MKTNKSNALNDGDTSGLVVVVVVATAAVDDRYSSWGRWVFYSQTTSHFVSGL